MPFIHAECCTYLYLYLFWHNFDMRAYKHMADIRLGSNPLYLDLAAKLRSEIDAGVYAVGDRMPSEPDLCSETGYSRSTVRKALQILVDQGYVSKSQGKGTFVLERDQHAQGPARDKAQFRGFTEHALSLGVDPSTRTVDFRMVAPTPGLAAFLGVGEDDRVTEIVRLRMVDGSPAGVETIWLPARFSELENESLDGSLYGLLERRYGLRPGGGTKSLGICRANHREAFLLGVPLGSPLMLAEDQVRDADGNPLHVTKTVARDDKYRYTFELTA